jgi:hypothetical protein
MQPQRYYVEAAAGDDRTCRHTDRAKPFIDALADIQQDATVAAGIEGYGGRNGLSDRQKGDQWTQARRGFLLCPIEMLCKDNAHELVLER